jgi:hypothetical protein
MDQAKNGISKSPRFSRSPVAPRLSSWGTRDGLFVQSRCWLAIVLRDSDRGGSLPYFAALSTKPFSNGAVAMHYRRAR